MDINKELELLELLQQISEDCAVEISTRLGHGGIGNKELIQLLKDASILSGHVDARIKQAQSKDLDPEEEFQLKSRDLQLSNKLINSSLS